MFASRQANLALLSAQLQEKQFVGEGWCWKKNPFFIHGRMPNKKKRWKWVLCFQIGAAFYNTYNTYIMYASTSAQIRLFRDFPVQSLRIIDCRCPFFYWVLASLRKET